MSEVFTKADFLNVFERYNIAVGLAPLVLLWFALLALGAIVRQWHRRNIWVSGVLAGLWIWSGIAYHWTFFADINPAAGLFGALFVGQGAALLYFGIWRKKLIFARPRNDARGCFGSLLISYATLIYPLVSLAVGHTWPRMPTFGVPCPLTLFTCGLLLWSKGPVPRMLLIVPVGWALLATIVAVEFEMYEDWGLLIAAAATTSLLWRRCGAETPARGKTLGKMGILRHGGHHARRN